VSVFDRAAEILGADVVEQVRADTRAQLAAHPIPEDVLDEVARLLNQPWPAPAADTAA
jgi:hypothetical protein